MKNITRFFGLFTLIYLLILLTAYIYLGYTILFLDANREIIQINYSWIPFFGINFNVLLDEFSLLFQFINLLCIFFATIYAIRAERFNNNCHFYGCIILISTVISFLFMTNDILMWLFLWELLTIFIFLISKCNLIKQNDKTVNSSKTNWRFLIYSQFSTLFMFISIIILAYNNFLLNNEWSFDYLTLKKTIISSQLEFFLMLNFLIAFIVRLPLIPFHNWYFDFHKQSSTATSIIINVALLNTSIFCFFKYVLPLFPNATLASSTVAVTLCFISFFYSIFLCLTRNDKKELILFMQIALVSYIIIIIYNTSILSYQGAIITMINLCLVMISLFIIFDVIEHAKIKNTLQNKKQITINAKHLLMLTQFFILYFLLIPGTSNILILYDSYQNAPLNLIPIIFGLFFLAITIVIKMEKIFNNENSLSRYRIHIKELTLVIIILMVMTLIGLYPQWIFKFTTVTFDNINGMINTAQSSIEKGNS